MVKRAHVFHSGGWPLDESSTVFWTMFEAGNSSTDLRGQSPNKKKSTVGFIRVGVGRFLSRYA